MAFVLVSDVDWLDELTISQLSGSAGGVNVLMNSLKECECVSQPHQHGEEYICS